MNLPKLLALALLVAAAPALAQVETDPYAPLIKEVQARLRGLGFYDGPVNGEIGPNTQAAITQFQLSVPIPASGMIDEATVAALYIDPRRLAQAAAPEPSAATGESPPPEAR